MAKIVVTHAEDEPEQDEPVAKRSPKKASPKKAPKKSIKVKIDDEPHAVVDEEKAENPEPVVELNAHEPEAITPEAIELVAAQAATSKPDVNDTPEEPSGAPEVLDETTSDEEIESAVLPTDSVENAEPAAVAVDEEQPSDQEVEELFGETQDTDEWSLDGKPESKIDQEAETPEIPVITKPADSLPLESQETDDIDLDIERAVSDVARSDSDDLISREDADLEAFKKPVSRSFGQKLKSFFAAWWHRKLYRNSTFAVLFVLIATAFVVPTSRYLILNTAGVRSSASLVVLDDTTNLPLKNVHVTAAGKTVLTDVDGKAKLEGIKLGQTDLVIEKRAFANYKQHMILGWGSNPLGQYKISATGVQYAFVVTDWINNKPIEKAEAVTGEASALSDKDGKISLVLDASAGDTPTITISLDNYRSEKITITGSNKDIHTVKLVPSKKHLFVSKRSGKYDVYKIDIDGKNEQLLVAGTGAESDDMLLAPNSSGKVAALVSTRDNARNKDGFVLSGLFLVDTETGALTKLAQSERIQIVDWIGDRLIYVPVAEGASGSNPKRHRLVSYDYKTESKKELAASNYFNDVLVVGNKIFYAPSNAYLENTANAKLFSSDADGSNLQTVLNREVWNIFRVDYGVLNIAAQQDWYSFKIGDTEITKLSGAPVQPKTKLFVDNSNRSKSLWLDDRDGKGVLLVKDTKTNQDKVLETKAGLKAPFFWLNDNTVIYRISTSGETADYVVSSTGGTAIKIRDVSNIGGIDRWYFY